LSFPPQGLPEDTGADRDYQDDNGNDRGQDWIHTIDVTRARIFTMPIETRQSGYFGDICTKCGEL
jgi:hypothetical protein